MVDQLLVVQTQHIRIILIIFFMLLIRLSQNLVKMGKVRILGSINVGL